MLVLEVGMLLGICGAASEDFKLEINNLFQRGEHRSPATEDVVVRERFSGAGPDNVDEGVRLNICPLGLAHPWCMYTMGHFGFVNFLVSLAIVYFSVCCVHLILFYAFS